MKKHITSKEEILEKAMEIAVDEGIDSVNIRKLAEKCNMAIGSMYNYYKSKEELIKEVSSEFWKGILENQERIYFQGMGFTIFLQQYYAFLYGRLAKYDASWFDKMDEIWKGQLISLLQKVLREDDKVNQSIWNMELNQDIFCEYVFVNMIALLRAGENNCRFFVFLLEHLLYN